MTNDTNLQKQKCRFKHQSNTIQNNYYTNVVLPSQTWTTTAQDKRKLVTAEMACLRRILGISLRDRVRNENIRQRIGTIPILEYIKRQQIKGLIV